MRRMNTKKLFVTGWLITILLPWQSIAQDAQAVEYASTITTEDLKKHLTYLASDELEGRDTGEKRAATGS